MQLIFKLVVVLLFFVVVVGCESMQKTPVSVTAEAEPAVMPFTPAPPPVEELTPQIVFDTLVGEVAAQRGDLVLAYHHQMEVAMAAGDAKSAERATRAALHMKKNELAEKAAVQWVRLAPNDISARQLLVMLLLQQDSEADVLEHLKAIVRIGQAKGDNGFLSATAVVSRDLGHGESIALMRRLVAEFPGDPWGRYALALTAMMHKDYDTAEIEAKGLLDQRPDWIKAYLVLSRIHVAREDKEAAKALLADAVGRFPEEPLLLAAYARILIDVKELESAHYHYRKLWEMEPDNETANYWLGVLSLEMERGEEARGYFEKLIALGKRSDVATYFLGRIEEDASQPDKAIDWYRKVHKGEFFHDAQIRIVRLLIESDRMKEGREWLQRLRIRMPEQAVRLYLVEAEILREQNAFAEVMALYDGALEAYADNEDLLYARALFAVTQGRVDILEADLRKVIAGNPEHADALNALGYTLADKTDRYQEALALVQQALKLKPAAPSILDSMGWVQFRLGNHSRALEYLQRAFDQLPDQEIAAHLGEVLWVMGERERAKAVWRQILEKEPESHHILDAMRRLLP
ncbi:MAG: tetratricopeptide repeat protein [Candidatus Sedimenticola sp. (ex Thyasira tokunagai)]